MSEIARDVVIVGADAVGLTAANALRMSGLSVAVLEAGDRVGEEADELPHLLAERLGEDVLLGQPVQQLDWSWAPSVTATSAALIVRARFAILSYDCADTITLTPALSRSTQGAPIHFATSTDMARTAASTIVETIRS